MKDIKIEMFGVSPEEKACIENSSASTGLQATISYHPEILKPGIKMDTSDAEVLSVFADSAVDASILDLFPNLKLVVTRSTGYDHIDLAECAKRGIIVSNVPTYGENTVAEFAFGLMLSLSRKIHSSSEALKRDKPLDYREMRGFDLFGKTLGVIGTGRIGRHAIKIAKGFGMKILAYDVHNDAKASAELGFEYAPLDTVLSSADVVSIHVPYSKETHHLIGAEALAKMKRTSIIINTSRGALVDTEALLMALNSGSIAGAGLDVLEEEAAIKDEIASLKYAFSGQPDFRIIVADHALLNMPNVIVTPHNAYNSEEALQRILDATVQNIKAWADGKPQNIVSN